jgi:ABC-type ATPase with predicted acetyltransferase domain
MADKSEISSCAACSHCGAEIKMGMDEECPGCHRDVKECIVDKDVTSSIYPM